MLTQVRIKISRISDFSISFKLNNKTRVLLKSMFAKRGLQENVCWRGAMTLKEIMIKDLQTYICIHLADLQAFHIRQMKNLVAKYSHYYVIGKLNIFFFLQENVNYPGNVN